MTVLERAARKSLAVVLAASLLGPAPLFAGELSVSAPAGAPAIGVNGELTVPSSRLSPGEAAFPPVSSVPLIDMSAVSAPMSPAAFATPVAGAAQAAQAAAPAIDAHPVLAVLDRLQKAGVSLEQAPTSAAEAQRLIQAANALPEGSAKASMLQMAKIVAAPSGSGVSERIDSVYTGAQASAASAGAAAVAAAPAAGLWRLVPNFLRPASKRPAPTAAPAPAPEPVDPKTLEVPAEKLRYSAPIDRLPASSREIETKADPNKPIIGQDAALKSMYYGMKMPGQHYNVFVSGPEGSGRETAAKAVARTLAETMPVPDDLVAVTNFADHEDPLFLELLPGTGPKLAAAVKKFVATYQAMLPQALNRKEIVAARKKIHEAVAQAQAKRQSALDEEVAQERLPGGKFGFKLVRESNGDGTATIRPALTYAVDGKMMDLTADQRDALIEGGAFTREEWDAAVAASKIAAKPFLEKYLEMAQENAALEKQADEKMDAINGQVAQALAEEASSMLIEAVSRGRHDTPAHKEYEKRAQARVAAVQAEALKVRLAGKYALHVDFDGQRPLAGLLKIVDGKPVPVSPEEFAALMQSGEVTREQIQAAARPLILKLMQALQENEEDHRAVHEADPLSPVEERAVQYVSMLARHAAMNYEAFLPAQDGEDSGDAMAALARQARPQPKDLYRVGVLRTQAPGQKGAPVVFVKDYSFDGIFGTTEGGKKTMLVPGLGAVKVNEPGGPLVKGGSLAAAGGGFWIANALDLLRSPGVWPALMRYVRSGEIEIVEDGIQGLAALKGGRFHAPSRTKIVLVGSPMIRMLLQQHDEDYQLNFPGTSSAEFEPNLPANDQSVDGYLQFIKKAVAQGGDLIAHFTRDGMAALLEYASKLAGSNDRLTAQFGAMHGLMREATEKAREGGRTEATRADVDAALAARGAAAGVYRKRLKDLQVNGVFKIETDGEAVGQINGLAVTGEDSGVAMRITAETMVREPGEPILASLDREASAELTGPSFNKALGVEETVVRKMIEELGWKKRLPVSFRLSFEQNYGGIDGDSATSTIIYALLSSLSGVPIKQQFANTGSSDQKNWVQAIGGINAKTAGFFDIAAAKPGGLTGKQGVLMPRTNVSDLHLRPDIVGAIKAGKFHIYQIDDIKQGMEVLTGVPWAVIQQRALARLQEYADAAKAGEKDEK